jgi:hypothetical protein
MYIHDHERFIHRFERGRRPKERHACRECQTRRRKTTNDEYATKNRETVEHHTLELEAINKKTKVNDNQ